MSIRYCDHLLFRTAKPPASYWPAVSNLTNRTIFHIERDYNQPPGIRYFRIHGLHSATRDQALPDPWIIFFQSRRLRMLRILRRWSEAFHTLATGQPRRVISILVLKSCRKIYNAAFFLSWFCHISVIPVKPPDTAICPHVLWYTFTGLHFLRDIDSSAVRSVPRSVHYVSCLSS